MKRRITALLLCICVVASLFPVAAFADTLTDPILQINDSHSHEADEEIPYTSPGAITLNMRGGTIVDSGTCGENAFWSFSSDGTLAISGSGSTDSYSSPLYSYGTKSPWNSYANDIYTIVINEGITEIGAYAFSGCQNLQNVEFSSTLTTLGTGTFMKCSNLPGISIPDNVNTIGSNCFQECTNLQRVYLPNYLSVIPQCCFYECSALTIVSIGNGLTKIESRAFSDCLSLTTIIMPNSVTTLGSEVFRNCEKLVTVPLSSGINAIPEHLFQNCSSLKSITIPVNVERQYFFMNAFDGCSSLQTIDVNPNNSEFSSIDGVLFSKDGKTLERYPTGRSGGFAIPDNVRIIGSSAFSDCDGLTSITIHDAITEMGGSAFRDCDNISSIIIPSSIDIIYDYTFYGCDKLKNVSLPQNLKSIRSFVFCTCRGLETITIPASVQSIGADAFAHCDSLRDLTLPSNLRSIDSSAFWCCSSLSEVTFPALLCTLGSNAFGHSGLTSVVLPETITSIGTGAFSGCYNLTSATVYSNVTSLLGVFESCNNLTSVVLPASVTDLSATFSGCSSLDSIILPENVANLSGAFSGCSSLDSIILPENVANLSGAFYGCSSLTAISIPESVTSIDGAFSGCTSLINIDISSDVTITSIGDESFYNCSGLTSIEIPNSVESIGFDAFSGCSSLVEITVPERVTDIQNGAFAGCTALESIALPSSLIDITGGLFVGCSSLETIVIPDNVMRICGSSFSGCSSLKSIIIPNSVDSIEWRAFYGCNSLSDVYYAGTHAEWNSISIGNDNAALENAVKHFVLNIGICGDNAVWTLYDDGALIVSGSGDMYDYAEPGYGTASPWADYKNQINSIVINSDITHIGTAAFYGSAATSITIQNANLSIGDYAFWNSANLTSIDFGGGTISPGNYVFNNCDALESVHLPVNVVMNGTPSGEGSGFEMFMSCSSLKTAVVDCAYIGRWMFEYCGQLESVTFTNPDVRFYYLDDGGSFSGSGNPFNGIENRTISLIGYSCSEVPRLAAEAGNASASRFLTFVPIENDPGHDYSMIDYVWSDDFSSVTATAICSRNAEHTLTETVTTTSEVTKTPTATEYGETTYTAVFSDTTFTTQTKTIADIPPVVEVGLYWRWPIEREDEETGEFYFVHNDSELPTNEEIVGFGTGTQDIEILYYNEDGQYIPLDYSELQFSGECITASERQRGFISIRYKALGTGTVRYEIGGEVYTLTIRSTLPDIGFYSSPVASEETYLTKWNISADNDTIYFVSRTDAVLTSVTEISSNGAVITLDPDGKYAAIQVTDPQERDLGIRFTFMDGHHSNSGTWWIDLIDDKPGLYWRWPLEKTDETTGDFYFVPNEDEDPTNEEIVGFGVGSQDVEILFRDEAGSFTALSFSDLQFSGDCIEGSEWQPGFVEIRYRGLGTGSISYETSGKMYTLTVLSELPDTGFYSSTVASEETYLTEWTVTADNNTVYFVARDDKVLTGVTEISSNGAVITLDASGKYAAIQVTDPQENQLGVRFTFTNGDHSGQGTWWLDLIDNTPVAQGLYWRWPDTTWEDDEPIITSNARASLETILRSFPYGDSFREFVYADENGTLNPVKCSQLTVTGDFFTIEPIQENYVILTCNDFGTGAVSYNGYSVTIESDLPTVGYYDEPAASQAHFIKEWVYDGTSDIIYIVADSGYTILEITDVRGSSFDVTLNSDGSYATAKLLELTDDQFIGVHYRVRDNYGGSWEDAIYITIKDNSVPVITGDADGDGKIGMDDRVLLSRYLAGWPGVAELIPNINALDINKDGKVNAKDRMILSRYLAGWGEPYNSYFNQ